MGTTLTRLVRLYVPGTVGAEPAPKRQQMMVRHVIQRLTNLFGGATAVRADDA